MTNNPDIDACESAGEVGKSALERSLDELERARELMALAAEYIREHAPSADVVYDNVVCDGLCLADDLEACADLLAAARAGGEG